MEAFDITKYPEGYEKLKESLTFLPEIDEVREAFLMSTVLLMVML